MLSHMHRHGRDQSERTEDFILIVLIMHLINTEGVQRLLLRETAGNEVIPWAFHSSFFFFFFLRGRAAHYIDKLFLQLEIDSGMSIARAGGDIQRQRQQANRTMCLLLLSGCRKGVCRISVRMVVVCEVFCFSLGNICDSMRPPP